MYNSHREMGKGHGMGAGTLGDYDPPAHKATTIRGSFMRKESSGVQSGLSALQNVDTEEATDIGVNYTRNPLTGNATERVAQNPTKTKGNEKGHSFVIW